MSVSKRCASCIGSVASLCKAALCFFQNLGGVWLSMLHCLVMPESFNLVDLRHATRRPLLHATQDAWFWAAKFQESLKLGHRTKASAMAVLGETRNPTAGSEAAARMPVKCFKVGLSTNLGDLKEKEVGSSNLCTTSPPTTRPKLCPSTNRHKFWRIRACRCKRHGSVRTAQCSNVAL